MHSSEFSPSGSVKSQCIYPLNPLDGVDANYWCFTRKINCTNNCIKLCGVEISLELIPRLPFLDQQKRLASVQIREEPHREAAWHNPCRLKHRSERAQQRGPHYVRHDDFQGKHDQSDFFRSKPAVYRLLRKKRATRNVMTA